MIASPKDALIGQLERARQLHEERVQEPGLAARLDKLAHWQSERLARSYIDLAHDGRYAKAIEFFRSDLYGPGDFSRRDADLARVVPIMARLVPAGVIATMATSMELSVISHQLDRDLLHKLDPAKALNVAAYSDAYRACNNRSARLRQIALIAQVGRSLDRYVGKPFVRSALNAMRGPARIAGLGALQDFLERGFASFAQMRGAEHFLSVIDSRETALMNAILAGEPQPFPEPDMA
jgi:hypothetical protein